MLPAWLLLSICTIGETPPLGPREGCTAPCTPRGPQSSWLVGRKSEKREVSFIIPRFGSETSFPLPQASIEQNYRQRSMSRGPVLGRGTSRVFGVGKFSEEGRRGLGGNEQHRKKLTRSLAARSAPGQKLGAGAGVGLRPGPSMGVVYESLRRHPQ